jgi:hypothetical protein
MEVPDVLSRSSESSMVMVLWRLEVVDVLVFIMPAATED